ncbi:hypothetical protein LEMLEM_LOCUS12899 [Lemmus lemmus]
MRSAGVEGIASGDTLAEIPTNTSKSIS